MAATKQRNIRRCLTLAACSLLGDAASAAETSTSKPWKLDLGLLYYAEANGRAAAVAPLMHARKPLENDASLTITAGFDTVSGASPTGAVPSSHIQTFTRPSGGHYQVKVGAIPMDSFHDRRYSAGIEWEKPFTRNTKGTYSAAYSKELDYISSTGSMLFSTDINKRSTTLAAGIAWQADRIEPGVGIPIAYEDATQGHTRKDESETRHETDFLLGLTQVLDRWTLLQLNYSLSKAEGYNTDHTKVFSLTDDQDGPELGNPVRTLFEKRPDTRKMQNIFVRIKHHFTKDIVDFSYRYLTDDWDIISHTLDFRYTLSSGSEADSYWQPHLRFYHQTAASFYHTNLSASMPLPAYMSADFRIGDLQSYTLGIKHSRPSNENERIAIRLEYMIQLPDAGAEPRPGNLANQNIVDNTKATILQLEYSF